METWRTWERVLPRLVRRHDVLAPTFAGHAGGPPLPERPDKDTVPDAVERAMDAAGFATAHFAGVSLGGFVALQLAARGRARSVVAFAPGGGWPAGDGMSHDVFAYQAGLHEQAAALGLLDIAGCDVPALLEVARRDGYSLDAERITCPVRVVWGTEDRLLPWPAAAERYRREWLPHAEWVELDGVGHDPQHEAPLETAELILGLTAGSLGHRLDPRGAAARGPLR
jgi:pimeloyl-ACP methyl ester carboxylesterase